MSNIWNQFTSFMSRFSTQYFFSTPTETLVVWIWIGFFLLFVLAIFVYYFYLRLKNKKNKLYLEYSKSFLWPNLTVGTIGLFLALFRYENIDVLSWRFWVYLNLLIIVVFNSWYLTKKKNDLEEALLKMQTKKRKEKWLTKK